MKKTFCILVVFSLTVVLLVACVRDPLDKISDDNLVTYYVTDENGNIETDTNGVPVIEYVTEDNKVTGHGGIEIKPTDDDGENWGELIPFN